MDTLIQNGLDWVLAVQGLGGWLEAPMQFFSFLGTQDFFLLVLPLIYWCIDARLGIRVAVILITSVGINYFFKLWFSGPRPYWVSADVQAYSAESTFGVPSGHAQNAVDVWGIIAAGIRKPWAWGVAIVLMFFIGFSRMYLGVHFPHDVIVGWLIGVFILWMFIRFWDAVTAWASTKTFAQQVTLALVVSILFLLIGMWSAQRLDGYTFPAEFTDNALRISDELPAPASMEDAFTTAGTLFGILVGSAWITLKGGYQADGPIEKRVYRFIVGLVGVLILWRGLALILPSGETFIALFFRYVRYALVGAWIIAGAPWLFFRINLARSPKA